MEKMSKLRAYSKQGSNQGSRQVSRQGSRQGSEGNRPQSLTSNVSFIGRANTEEEGPIEFQRSGYLCVKKFKKDAVLKGNFSRPYWFVLKDGFLIWYRLKPTTGFDIYPVGCLPTGGCLTYGPWIDEKNGGYIFEVANRGFKGHSLVLRTETNDTEGIVAQSWINYVNESRVATWENSVYGDVQIIQMENKNKIKDKKNEKLYEELNENAKATAIAANQKIMLMEKKLEEDRVLKGKLRKLKRERKEIGEQLGTLKQALNIDDIPNFAAGKDVKKALEYINDEIATLSGTIREKVEANFAQVKEFIDDCDFGGDY